METPEQLLNMVLREFGPRVVSVTMFGSWVKNRARSDSDYDLVIIMDQLDQNPNVREEHVASATANILLRSGVRISPLVLSRDEAMHEVESGSPLFATILADYDILYDPSKFMAELLDLTKRSRSRLTYVERGRSWDLARTV